MRFDRVLPGMAHELMLKRTGAIRSIDLRVVQKNATVGRSVALRNVEVAVQSGPSSGARRRGSLVDLPCPERNRVRAAVRSGDGEPEDMHTRHYRPG